MHPLPRPIVAVSVALLLATWPHETQVGVVNRDQLRRAATHLGDADLLQTLALGGVAAMAVSPWDADIVDFAVDRQWLGPNGDTVGKWAGHRWTVLGQMAVIPTLGWALGHDGLRDAGLLLWPAQLATQAVVQGLKYTTRRARPDGGELRSFPSGHAAGTWTTATVLYDRLGPRVGIPAYVVAAYIGLSRLQANKHHLGDVLFGFAVAHWCTKAVTRSSEPTTLSRWLPRPTVMPTRDGVGLTLLQRAL